MDIFAAIAAERRSLADLLLGLDLEQQNTQSLCTEWTVRQVAGHLIVPLEVGMPGFMAAMLRHRGDFDAANAELGRRQALRPWEEIVEILRDKADSRFTPPGQGPEAPLTDVLVHGLDITTPLGLTHEVSPEHLRISLDYLAAPNSRARAGDVALAGLRLEATDLDWTHGAGPLVRGDARSLLLALAGREPGFAGLGGDLPGAENA
ncbi:maleylpyruvate isomerase family mycothiol-dependent enzyme [Luteococcus sp. Sow4_B9]|uniref:maleylpyruvate isomerase family mycothiol-dependent enzyme n=1 Tax=Luteococcus sp. Sow4_B9 TaxID=3438792 RepID=UPI003F94D0FF